jgi:NAD(P)H-flavin reductase
VKVIQVFSDNGSDGKKYVQDVFGSNKDLDGADKAGVGVVLCGHKDMCNAIKDLVAAEGVDAEKVLLNF